MSVIIPVRNGAEMLKDQLEALTHQELSEPWEVVVADNGSTDQLAATVGMFENRLPRLRLIDASGRTGASHARNVGARAAAGDHLIFVDADDVVSAGYLQAMHAGLVRSPCVAGRRDDADREGLSDAYAYLPWAGSGYLGVRREAFDLIGGFDEQITEGEDADFCWRAQLAAQPLEFVPGAILAVRHREGVRSTFRQGRRVGAAGPALYRKFCDRGMPRRSPRAVVRFWGGLVLLGLRIRSREDLDGWMFLLGCRVGIIQGCVRHRVLFL